MPTSSSTSSSEAGGSAAARASVSWLRRLWLGVPCVRWTLAWLFLGEFVVGVVAPLVVPDRLYLRGYLGREAINSTRSFVNASTSYLVWDPVTGWRNRPGSQRSVWRVDDQGARRSTRYHEPNARLALFLGDSVTNGGTALSNDETISALIEDDEWSSANFATMLYGVDQMLLALKNQLASTRPSVVVIGVTQTSIEALGNRYVPFRRRSEVNMPFLKPRFALQDGRLKLLAVPPRQAYDDLLGEGRILTELARTDRYFSNFAAYRRSGVLPLSGLLDAAAQKSRRLAAAVKGETESLPLLVALMREIVGEAQRRGARAVFLLHATADEVQTPRWRRVFPDAYGRLLSRLRTSGFDVVDVREALRHSGKPLGDLYSADRLHYRVEGNRIVASALRSALRE